MRAICNPQFGTMKKTRLGFRNRGKGQGETEVKVIYQYDRTKKIELGTGVIIMPTCWNSKSREVKRSHPMHQKLNNDLLIVKTKVDTIIRDIIVRGGDPLPEIVKSQFAREMDPYNSQVGFFDEFETWLERKKDQVSIDAHKDYKSLRKHLNGFQEHRGAQITFRQINYSFYEDFIIYCELHVIKPNGEIGLARGTVGKQIKNLKVFLKNCIRRNIIDYIPLEDWKVFRETGDHIYLTEEELEIITQMDFTSEPQLELVRDLFIVGCETGLRYSDFSRISPHAIQGDFIRTRTRKTLTQVIIPISARLRRMLEKYDNLIPQNYPKHRFNWLVKEVVRKAGIVEHVQILKHKGNRKTEEWIPKWKLVASHTCRRSFCTNAFKKGMPVMAIRGVSGHSSEKNLLTYVKAPTSQISEIQLIKWLKTNDGFA